MRVVTSISLVRNRRQLGNRPVRHHSYARLDGHHVIPLARRVVINIAELELAMIHVERRHRSPSLCLVAYAAPRLL